MEENGRPFDHDWGPLVDKDFESKPIFHTLLIDSHMDGFMEKGLEDQSMESSSPEMEFRGSIAERRAEKFGFHPSSINVAQVRTCSSPPSSSPSRSPYLTIPPGLSPAALLESPVMLSNSQPSPTTGTFPLASCNNDSLAVKPVSPTGPGEGKDSAIDSFAKFKPPADPTTQMPRSSTVENQPSETSKSPVESRKEDSIKSCAISKSTKAVNMTPNESNVDMKPCNTDIADKQMPTLREYVKNETGAHHPLGEDQKGTGPSAAGMTRNAEDGYCWRKYGQKHVKGSEYPRSYYKCNSSNCPVKKKVERSHDGEITEIIYKGAHNHPKPQPRLSLGRAASSAELLETSKGVGSCPKVEGGAGWRHNQLSSKDFRVNSDWRAYGLERTSSTALLNEISDPFSASKGKSGRVFGSVENPELGSTIPSREGEGEDEDGATQGSTSPSDDADGDESEPKRRKKEMFSAEAYLQSRSTREPRIILQIESEIDVLDDGYRWRKYGQKVVKGNPNPRSYYKCTSAGCPVRKHVERASEDIKSVITTYEGKHNHEVPTAKTNGTASVGNSPPNASDPHSILALPTNVSNPEIQIQDLPLHYQMKPNNFSRSNLLGDLVSNMNLGASSIYQMKFSPLQSPMTYSPFGMNSNGSETHTSCIGAPVMPEFPMSIHTSIPRSTNVAVSSSFHSNHHSRINGPVQSSVGNQQMKESGLRFFKPKEEQKDDHFYDNCLATPPDNADATSSTVFCGAIGNFPS